MAELERIKKINVRTVWPDEAKCFTPWLGANLDQLGSALGMNLERREEEHKVGPFSLDILAKETDADSIVVIENQLGDTNHDHLGKLITYASGTGASVAVWITTEVRSEHRQAMEWLNSKADRTVSFFGVVIEVLQIGNSPYAPYFDVVVSPNDWRRPKVTSPMDESCRRFLQALVDDLQDRPGFTAEVAAAQHWHIFASGITGASFSACLLQKQKTGRVECFLEDGELYEGLKARSEALEKELGGKLCWETDGPGRWRISHYYPGNKESQGQEAADKLPNWLNSSELPDWLKKKLAAWLTDDLRSWMVGKVVDFKRVFTPHLQDLDKEYSSTKKQNKKS